MGREITPDEFRATIGLFATGVTVVTTTYEGILHGMTANAFASVSLEPFLVLVCVDREAGMHELLPRSKTFAVTVLGADQTALSDYFASARRPTGQDQFEGVDWDPAPVTGCPIVHDGLGWADCRVTEIHEGGDHSIFLGEVLDLGLLRHGDPLVFFGGTYHRLRIDP